MCDRMRIADRHRLSIRNLTIMASNAAQRLILKRLTLAELEALAGLLLAILLALDHTGIARHVAITTEL